MTNKKHSKKRGFTLIEMLIVIVIIGILAAYLIPRISSAQGKARDVARQADVNQLSTALASYSLDYGNFPGGSGTTAGSSWNGCIDELSRALVDKGYISSISKDPSRKQNTPFCSTGGAYGFFTDGGHYLIITSVDELASANFCSGGQLSSITKLDHSALQTLRSSFVQNPGDCETVGEGYYVYLY